MTVTAVILTNWTIYFETTDVAGGDKQITWTGTTGTNTVNELYSAIQDEMDDSSGGPLSGDNMQAGSIMSAQTPTEFTIGQIETNDPNAWFIDPESIKHLTGGALSSKNWLRVVDTNTGIFKVGRTGSNIVIGDVGFSIAHGDGDAGVLLHVETSFLWIRPDTSAAADDFSTSAGTLTANGHADTQSSGATTGEMIWSNIFKIGTTSPKTTFLVAQNNVEISNVSIGNGTWWPEDALDVLILTTNQDTLIDGGRLTIYARQYSQLYAHFITTVAAGGRTAIPLQAADDSNNDTGNRTFTGSSGTGTFTVGEVIYVGASEAAATKKGILTAVAGTAGDPILTYYLIGDLTNFAVSDAVKQDTPTSTTTAGTPTDAGPAASPDNTITVVFGQIQETFDTSQAFTSELITTDTAHPFITGNRVLYTKEGGTEVIGLTDGNAFFVNNQGASSLSIHATEADANGDTSRIDLTTAAAETHKFIRRYDLDDNDTSEVYSIIIDAQGLTNEVLYERLKHIVRRGETATLAGVEGQQYIGIDYRVDYTGPSATPLQEGETVTQTTSGATGIILHNNTDDQYVMLRDSTGTFDGTNVLTDDSSNTATATGNPEIITPNAISTFGTLAGGRFFGGRSVWIDDVAGADANSFELIADDGITRFPPATRNFTVTGLVATSEVRIFLVSDDTEVTGTESSGTTFNHQYVFSTNTPVYIIILHINFNWLRINGQQLLDQDQSIPVFQIFDRDYLNPA